MEPNIPGGTGPHWKPSLVHLLTYRKMLAQLTGSCRLCLLDKYKAMFD